MAELESTTIPAKNTLGLELAIIPLGVALNLALGSLVQWLKLPIYVDAIGTIAVTMLVGLRAGIIAGVLGNVLPSVLGINPNLWAFSGTQAMIAIFTHIVATRGAFSSYWKLILAGLGMGVVSALVSAPVAVLVFGGVTASGTSLIVAVLMKSGQNIWASVIKAAMVFDVSDKVLQYLLVGWLLRGMPKSLLRAFPGKALRINKFLGDTPGA
jgi:energy-coupling factor transport system substrate-specific component